MFVFTAWDIKKSADKTSHSLLYVFVLAIAALLSACGGGGGGGGGGGDIFGLDGGAVSGSFDPTSSAVPAVYSFNVVAGTPYTVSLVNTSGDTALYVYASDPIADPTATPIGISWTDGIYENVSFIADYTGTVYAFPLSTSLSATTYTIEATTNRLTVGALARTAATYGGGFFSTDLFYSFEAQAGIAYEVRVVPTQGNVDLTRVTPNTDMTGSVGSSANTGTTPDSVFFTAAATQRYYIRVDGTGVDSIFGISVHEVPAGPDLSVAIDNAVSDGTNVILDYTIYNNGADDYTGNVQVDLWADAATVPGVGLTGDNSVTHSGVTITALGGSLSGTVSIANAAETGTAYAVVDTLEAVVEGNETNNVSAGVSWQKPLLAPVNFDFETGVIPAKVVMSGDANWLIDTTTGGNGSTTSLRSGNIGHSQVSCFVISVYNSQSTRISFDRKVSSESWDDLLFYIDGIETGNWSGTVAWDNVSYTNISGLHEYKWCYDKDFTGSSGTDEAWVDNISIITEPTDLSVAINNVSTDGADVTINYTVSNNTAMPAGAFAVDFWSDAALTPVVGDSGETSVNHTSLAAFTSASGTVTIANAAASGTAYAIVDTADAVQETDETNNDSIGVAWSIIAPELSVSIVGASSDATNVTINYTVTNNGTGDAGAFEVDLWADLASAPVIGNTGDTSVAYASLTAGNSVSGSVVIASSVTSGTAYAIVDTTDSVFEIDETNNISAGFSLSTALSIYDFESGLVPAAFVMSGDAGWTADNTNGTGSSTTSLRSGVITDSQTSCTAITVLASSSVAFDYNVSSESGYDYLRFYIDGVRQDFWSGLVAWSNASYTITTGSHEYKWCYEKDGSVSRNADAVWIDNIVIN